MSASFPMACPYCRKATRAPAEAMYRWHPDAKGGRSTRAQGPESRDKREVDADFGSHCPECGDPFCIRVRGPAAVFALVASGALREIDLELREHELSLVRSFPESKPKRSFAPTVPASVAEVLPILREDCDKERNLDGVMTGACRALGALISALEAPNPSKSRWLSPAPPTAEAFERRLRGLVSRGRLTQPIADWSRRLGRPPTGGADKRVVEDWLALVEAVLEVGFTAPHRLASRRDSPSQKA